MRILYILLILMLLVVPLVSCDAGNQSGSVRASINNDSEPTIEANILGIELALQDLNERVTALELKIYGELYENPWAPPKSLEARLKVIEDKLGIRHFP